MPKVDIGEQLYGNILKLGGVFIMWEEISEFFKDSPQRLQVAQAIIRHGFKITGKGRIQCRSVKIPLKSLADALDIDRRTVRATTEDICSGTSEAKKLFEFFSRIEPAGPSLEKVSEVLGHGFITIYVKSPENPGIVSEVTSTIAGYGIPIRQVIAEDMEIYPEPCLKVITDEPLKGAIIENLTEISGVSRVIINR
ncbi:MAG: hypothetical protein BAJATHORv1_30127 [Candidatus Thorarchaeota archaeon]|nr:MAG: hypothetical protein BAJATHORv1_30127 [Candidatus Thorarchaeota archaeon]